MKKLLVISLLAISCLTSCGSTRKDVEYFFTYYTEIEDGNTTNTDYGEDYILSSLTYQGSSFIYRRYVRNYSFFLLEETELMFPIKKVGNKYYLREDEYKVEYIEALNNGFCDYLESFTYNTIKKTYYTTIK